MLCDREQWLLCNAPGELREAPDGRKLLRLTAACSARRAMRSPLRQACLLVQARLQRHASPAAETLPDWRRKWPSATASRPGTGPIAQIVAQYSPFEFSRTKDAPRNPNGSR